MTDGKDPDPGPFAAVLVDLKDQLKGNNNGELKTLSFWVNKGCFRSFSHSNFAGPSPQLKVGHRIGFRPKKTTSRPKLGS